MTENEVSGKEENAGTPSTVNIWSECGGKTASEYRGEEGCVQETQVNVKRTLGCRVRVTGLRRKKKRRRAAHSRIFSDPSRWKYRTTDSRGLLEWLGLNSALLLPTARRQRSCVRVPAEGDKGVTGSSEVSLVISQWQPCSARGQFSQTLAELASDPAGLSHQLPSADSGSASKDLHNVWGDKWCSFLSLRPATHLEGAEMISPRSPGSF